MHQTRVASRRLREALPVFAAHLKGAKVGKARRRMRQLTRALGGVREFDVALALLEETRSVHDVDSAAVAPVCSYLTRARDVHRARMLDRLADLDTDGVVRRLSEIQTALTKARDDGAWRVALADRLARRAAHLHDMVAEAGALYLPDRLHAVRIAAKKLRYALELTCEVGLSQADDAVRKLKDAQDLLGRLQDLDTLVRHVAAAQADPAFPPPDRAPAVPALSRGLEADARQLHSRYLAMTPELTAVCDRTIAEVVAHVRPAAGRTRGSPLKMTLARGVSRRQASARTASKR